MNFNMSFICNSTFLSVYPHFDLTIFNVMACDSSVEPEVLSRLETLARLQSYTLAPVFVLILSPCKKVPLHFTSVVVCTYIIYKPYERSFLRNIITYLFIIYDPALQVYTTFVFQCGLFVTVNCHVVAMVTVVNCSKSTYSVRTTVDAIIIGRQL